MSTCRWVATNKARILTGRHDYDCRDEACRGCQPCEQPHCRICRHAHVAGACAECLAETREALHEIGRMCDALPEEVEHRGINGEAMMLLGPAADPEARGHLEASVLAGRVPADYLDHADSDRHPLYVLGTWDMVVRDALEHDEPGERLTVATALDYLDRQLTYLAGYEHLPFEDMARDLRACRTHMESVLHDGEQIEQGAPCLTCRRPVTRGMAESGEYTYRCERCRRDLTANEYRLAVHAAHIAHADRLNVDDLAERIEVPASTIRSWASILRVQRRGQAALEHPPLIRSCGRDSSNRKVYRVADALKVRDMGGDRRRSGIVSNAGGDKCSLEAV